MSDNEDNDNESDNDIDSEVSDSASETEEDLIDIDEDKKEQKLVEIRRVKPDDMRCTDRLQLVDIASLLIVRTEQIRNGSHIFVDINGLTNPEEIALEELYTKNFPLMLVRDIYVEKNYIIQEYWDVNDMELLDRDSLL